MIYHVMLGVCILIKLKSINHARYLVISTMLFCLLIIIVSKVDGISGNIEILSLLNTLLVTTTVITNISFFMKAMKSEKKKIVCAILACLLMKGTKEERRRILEEYFDFNVKG